MTPTILAVDTTSEHGSIALWRGGLMEEVALFSPEGFSPVIFGEMERLLARHGILLAQVDVFVAASGPGSFTGVRVGLAAVKGLAEATGKPCVGVSNLRALSTFGTRPLRAPVIDARRGEIYGAVYDDRAGLVADEVVAPWAAWLETLPAGDLEIVTAGSFPHASIPTVQAPLVLAGAVAKIAIQIVERSGCPDVDGVDANYVRRSDAELLWKDPRAL